MKKGYCKECVCIECLDFKVCHNSYEKEMKINFCIQRCKHAIVSCQYRKDWLSVLVGREKDRTRTYG